MVLALPDGSSIAYFLLTQGLRDAEVNFVEKTVTAMFTETDIEVAKDTFGAIIKEELPNSYAFIYKNSSTKKQQLNTVLTEFSDYTSW